MYCVPNPKVKLLKLADVVKAMQLTHGVYYTFLGMKKADGMNRRLMLKGYEVNDYENNGMVYPLADWTQKDILAYMRQHNLPEPVRYSLKPVRSRLQSWLYALDGEELSTGLTENLQNFPDGWKSTLGVS